MTAFFAAVVQAILPWADAYVSYGGATRMERERERQRQRQRRRQHQQTQKIKQRQSHSRSQGRALCAGLSSKSAGLVFMRINAEVRSAAR